MQLYMSPMASSLPSDWRAPIPNRKLIDYAKVSVGVGESLTVSFTVDAEQLRLTDMDGTRKLVSGSYRLTFTNGGDQALHDIYEVNV